METRVILNVGNVKAKVSIILGIMNYHVFYRNNQLSRLFNHKKPLNESHIYNAISTKK